MTDALQILGSKIRKKREAMGLSQEAFADKCNFDRTYISLLERGKRNVSLLNLIRIANGLDSSVSSLTEGIDSGTHTQG